MTFVFPTRFNPQPRLQSESLFLRPLLASDHHPLAAAASDPEIWAGHPSCDRYQQNVFDPYFEFLVGMGGALAIIDTVCDRMIGCSAYYTDTNAPSRLSIGFTFVTREHWGGETNRELKKLMLEHIFAHASEAWFHIAPTNLRSRAATKKLGAVFTHQDTVNLGSGAMIWQCFCLTREAWAASFSSEQGRGSRSLKPHEM